MQLPTLVYRHLRGDIIECYKLTSGKYDSKVANFLTYHRDVVINPERTRGHNKKLYVSRTNKVVRSNSFVCRIADIWNNLPKSLVNSPSINSFKCNLDKHWRQEEVLYDFKKLYNKHKDSTRDICFGENYDDVDDM